MLVFEAKADLLIEKVRKLFDHTEKQKSETETPSKKIKLENKENEGGDNEISPDLLWVSLKDP